jgi:D-serine deaminase-like pyridoxal phosphate-dependent protein
MDGVAAPLGFFQTAGHHDAAACGIGFDGVRDCSGVGNAEYALQHFYDVLEGVLIVIQDDHVIQVFAACVGNRAGLGRCYGLHGDRLLIWIRLSYMTMATTTQSSKFDLPTPALMVDLDRFEANVQKMQLAVTRSGKELRPHAKAHKCVEISRRQMKAGAVGVCVATMSEMQWLTAAGIGVLLTTPVASPIKTDSIAALVKAGAGIRVVIDHPEQARLYQESAARAEVRISMLVDLDVGDHRTGIPCDERAIALARSIAESPNLRFVGLQAYSVTGSHTEGSAERRKHSSLAIGQAISIQRELLAAGMDARTLTGASTGTWDIDTTIPEVTEIQAGSYPLMDAAYRRIVGEDFAPAMTVLATVISASHPDRVTVDAGYKAFATDRPFGPEPVGLTGVRWQWGGDEHGILHLENPSRPVRLGDRIEFIPPHCDPTVNLYDRIHATRGERVEEIWPTKGH